MIQHYKGCEQKIKPSEVFHWRTKKLCLVVANKLFDKDIAISLMGTDVDIFLIPEEWDFYDVLIHIGQVSSRTDARRLGYKPEMPQGYWYKKLSPKNWPKTCELELWNPIPPPQKK